MQYFKKDMKQILFQVLEFQIVPILFQVLEFQIVPGQPSETFSLPPANSTCGGQVGNCLFLTRPMINSFSHYTYIFRVPSKSCLY